MLFDGGDWNLYRYAAADPVNKVDFGGEAVAAQMANDQAELEKMQGEESKRVMSRRKLLMKRLCKNGATIMERYSKLKGKIDKFDAHHVMQDAAMLGVRNYFGAAGIAIPLVGRFSGSPHSLATAAQNRLRGAIPDVWVATEALHYAGCDENDIERIMKVVEKESANDRVELPF
jgi:hypothetical protein